MTGKPYLKIIKKFHLSIDEWYRIASELYIDHLKNHVITTNELKDLTSLNEKLLQHALIFPRLASVGEINKLNKALSSSHVNLEKIEEFVSNIVMDPHMRTIYYKGCYSIEKINGCLNPVYPFKHIILSATISFFRRNYIASYMTIIPVIEGILLRWQGFPNGISKKPRFKDSTKYLQKTYIRQPLPELPQLFDTQLNTAINILENHLFKPTHLSKSDLDFNRHLVAHLLYDANFATKINIVRAFNLIDTIFDLFLHEMRESVSHYFHMDTGWFDSPKTEEYRLFQSLEIIHSLKIKMDIPYPEDLL